MGLRALTALNWYRKLLFSSAKWNFERVWSVSDSHFKGNEYKFPFDHKDREENARWVEEMLIFRKKGFTSSGEVISQSIKSVLIVANETFCRSEPSPSRSARRIAFLGFYQGE